MTDVQTWIFDSTFSLEMTEILKSNCLSLFCCFFPQIICSLLCLNNIQFDDVRSIQKINLKQIEVKFKTLFKIFLLGTKKNNKINYNQCVYCYMLTTIMTLRWTYQLALASRRRKGKSVLVNEHIVSWTENALFLWYL